MKAAALLRRPAHDGELGFTLIEIVVVVAIMAIFAVLVIGFFPSSQPDEPKMSEARFQTFFLDARQLASISGNGATITVDPFMNGNAVVGSTVTLYRGRPDGNGMVLDGTAPMQLSIVLQLVDDSGIHESFNVFIASNGGLSYYLRQLPPLGYLPFISVKTCAGQYIDISFQAARSTEYLHFPCAFGLPMPASQ